MTGELPGDLWAYQRQCDESRWRFAMFVVESAAADVLSLPVRAELDGPQVVLTISAPWWAPLTLGLWTWHWRKMVMAEVVIRLPVMCGWCPKVRFK